MAGRLSITFDDGLTSVYSLAFPEMERHGLTGTAFVVSDLVGKQYLGHPVMTQRMLHDLCSAGWEIGSHTKTHARLPDLPSQEVDAELRLSRDSLERAIGRRVTSLAYPYGGFGLDRRIALIATRHYLCARSLSCYPPLRLNPIDPPERMKLNAMGSREPALALPSHLYSTYAPTFLKQAVRKLPFNRTAHAGTGVGGERTSLDARTVGKWIRRNLEKSRWLILCYHNLVREKASTSYDVSLNEFSQMVKIAASVSEVTTINDALRDGVVHSAPSINGSGQRN